MPKPQLGDHRVRSFRDVMGNTRWRIESYERGLLYFTRHWLPTHLISFKTEVAAEERLREDTAPAGKVILHR